MNIYIPTCALLIVIAVLITLLLISFHYNLRLHKRTLRYRLSNLALIGFAHKLQPLTKRENDPTQRDHMLYLFRNFLESNGVEIYYSKYRV